MNGRKRDEEETGMTIQSKNTIAIPPGATIREQLQYRGMSQKEFAERMGLSEKHVSRLINGKVPLSPSVADCLEMVLGVPAKYWNRLEAAYRTDIEKIAAENEMDEDRDLVKRFPYNEISELGWVPKTRNLKERVINLRKYFEVSSLRLLDDALITGIACRKLGESEKSNYALITWAQKAKLEARKIETSPVNIQRLKKNIPEIRKLTLEQPLDARAHLREILSQSGIAIVYLPHLKGSYLQGASFSDHKKIVLGITSRQKNEDVFWFSLFHEIGHIIQGDIHLPDGPSREEERRADRFAADHLINPEDYRNFVGQHDFSVEAVSDFSNRIGIDQGIVIGRLQKEGYVPFNKMNQLKKQFIA